MDRNTQGDGPADEGMVRDGNLEVEERMNRREGLVEYEGTVGGGGSSGGGLGTTDADSSRIAGGSDQAVSGGGANDIASMYPLPSMSTDQSGSFTATDASMMTDSAAGNVLSQVREGMQVIDSAGDDVGKVDMVHIGDPGAATTAGQSTDDDNAGVVVAAPLSSGTNTGSSLGGGSGVAGLAGMLGGGEIDVDEPLRSQLLRTGFVRVDGKGWFGTDHYLPAERIASVSGDTVTLNTTKDAIAEGR